MRLILILLASLTLINCSDIGEPRPPHDPEPILEAYVERFGLHYDGSWPGRLDIFFKELDDCDEDHVCTAGYCLTAYDNEGEFKELVVDISIWANLSAIRKEALMFHELGHCVMDLDHVEEEISFMLPGLQRSEWYLENRTELYVDLFGIEPIDDDIPVDDIPDDETEYKLDQSWTLDIRM